MRIFGLNLAMQFQWQKSATKKKPLCRETKIIGVYTKRYRMRFQMNIGRDLVDVTHINIRLLSLSLTPFNRSTERVKLY